MGGCSVDEDCEIGSLNGVCTVVLVGRTGNGKSATSNSILRKNAFKSKSSSSGVTNTCELHSTVLEDGLTLNVIDTPGLFDSSVENEFIAKEIVKCIDMAKDGIHAVLVVLSVRSRFSKEEVDTIMSLQKIFGPRISDYMVVVFTGGDDLEENDVTLDDYLGRDSADPLREILDKCGNRRLLFDNRSKDEGKRAEQLKELIFLVDEVVRNNGGKPFSNEIFAEFKKREEILRDHTVKVNSSQGLSKQEIIELTEQMQKAYDEQMSRITKMVEDKLKETALVLEQQLAEERAERLKVEEIAAEAQKKSEEKVRVLKEKIENAEKKYNDVLAKNSTCAIL